MENFGILLSIPAALVASSVYCAILVLVVSRSERMSRWLWWASVAVLGLFVLEVVFLATIGAVGSRRLLGPAFYLAHVLLFFFGTPALANLFLLRRRSHYFLWSCAAVVLCTVFAFASVLLQYYVSEALYGVNGTDGPFSKLTGSMAVPRSECVQAHRPSHSDSGTAALGAVRSNAAVKLTACAVTGRARARPAPARPAAYG